METLTFGPEGILFIGDTKGGSIYAIETRDNEEETKAAPIKIDKMNAKIAGMVGVAAKSLKLLDLAVNPVSQNIYVLVRREEGSQTRDLLFKIGNEANIEDVPLENIRYSKISIENAPGAEAKLWRRSARTYTITDISYAGGELFVSGLSNEEFASSLRRIPFPFTNTMATTGLQVYHVSHGANETHAPIHRFLPYEFDQEMHIVAGYMCTPLVTFPVPELKNGAKIIGKTVAELGAGNTPTGIISYKWARKSYILVGNNRHPLMKFNPQDIANAVSLEHPSRERGTKRTTFREGSIRHIADYNADYIVVVNKESDDSLTLRSIAKSAL
jgi:hypothetical protein